MKVLLCHRPGGAFGFITDSFINALRSCGHAVQRWDAKLDSWHQFDPDLYIGCSGHRQPVPRKGRCKLAFHVNPYGPVNIPGINESDDSIGWVLAQNPDAVFGYGWDDDALLWSHWTTKHNVPWVPMPTAGDDTIFKITGQPRQPSAVYLGGRWAYKAKTIDPFLGAVRDAQLPLRIAGWGEWEQYASNYSGPMNDDEVVPFFNSGTIAPCISEQHTHSHNIDLPERAFKTALCGLVVVHDCSPAVRKFIPSAVVCQTPEQMVAHIRRLLDPAAQAEVAALAEQQRTEVLSQHTYRHRVSRLLRTLKFDAEADSLIV
jgi:hypothetical protein